MPAYTLTEPSPSTAVYTRCGRGGAGNITRAPASVASTPAATTSLSSSSARRFFSGIGGAGNVQAASARPPAGASLDDALRHAAARDSAPMGYCGRGGAGNVFYNRKPSDASSVGDASSTRSSMSSSAKLWARVTGKE